MDLENCRSMLLRKVGDGLNDGSPRTIVRTNAQAGAGVKSSLKVLESGQTKKETSTRNRSPGGCDSGQE